MSSEFRLKTRGEFVTKESMTLSSTPAWASLTISAEGGVRWDGTGGSGERNNELSGAFSICHSAASAVGALVIAARSRTASFVVVVETGTGADSAISRSHPPARGSAARARARLHVRKNSSFILVPFKIRRLRRG